MTRVLVTRPEPGATRTVERLKKIGYEPVKLPLTRICGLDPRLRTAQFDFIIATSAQAFLCLPNDLAARLANVPTLVVGAATAAAAKDAGFIAVDVGSGDVEALILQIKGRLNPKAEVLYLCGRIRRPDLERALSLQGMKATVLEVYDTTPVSYSTDKLEFLITAPIDAVLLTSLSSAHAMAQILMLPEVNQAFDKSMYICLSERICGGLTPSAGARIIVCPTPDEDAMIEQLIFLAPR